MKNLFILLMFVFAFAACDNKKTSEHSEVISTDTTDVTYDVERTVVETDTTIDIDTVKKTDEIEVEKK